MMKPIARRTPARDISAIVSARKGCQLRIPTYTGSGVPASASRTRSPSACRRVSAVIGDTPPNSS